MSDESSTDLAERRTKWAEDRTILANERTFAGWMRTGMACVALALGLKAVFGDFEPTWLPKATASGFCLIGIFIFYAARRKAVTTSTRMNDHDSEPQSTMNMTVVASLLSAGAAVTGAVLWML